MRAILTAACLAAAAQAAAQETAAATLPLWTEAEAACRDGAQGAAETRAACARRDHFTHRLSRLGQCFGRKGQPIADYAWHACGAGLEPARTLRAGR